MGQNTVPRVICVGANLESLVALERLVACGANVVGLVTLPSEDHKGVSDYVDLHPFCKKNGIHVIDTLDINASVTLTQLRELNPDYIFTLGWSQLFKEELLGLPHQYIVGSHPSPLPEGRGRAPIPWTILEQQKYTAVTLFRMTVGVDDGSILIQKWFRVPRGVYAKELYDLVAMKLGEAFCELYQSIISGQVVTEPQDMAVVTYRAKRTPQDGHIDFSRSAEDIERLIRAVSEPYPGAYTYYQGRIVRIWRASLEDVPSYFGQPGQILTKSNERILVQAGDRPLWMWQFTDMDDAILSVRSFRNGSKFGFALEDEIYALREELFQLKQQLKGIR